MKIITFGGGTGHHQLALALKNFDYETNFYVATWDNGGSSKFLRIGEKILPPGDIRNVYSALSNLDEEEKEIFWDGRVDTYQESKHSIGNLKLALLIKKYNNNWDKINKFLKKHLKIKENFNVYPITLNDTDLISFFETYNRLYLVKGEEEIDNTIKHLKIEPKEVSIDNYELNEKVLEDLNYLNKNKGYVIISPGSFYTSVYPHFSIQEISDSLKKLERDKKIVIANIFYENSNVEYKLKKLFEKIGYFTLIVPKKEEIDKIPKEVKVKYQRENKNLLYLTPYIESIAKIVETPLISEQDYGRHDPKKLYNILKELTKI